MNVKELIDVLQELDPERLVVVGIHIDSMEVLPCSEVILGTYVVNDANEVGEWGDFYAEDDKDAGPLAHDVPAVRLDCVMAIDQERSDD